MPYIVFFNNNMYVDNRPLANATVEMLSNYHEDVQDVPLVKSNSPLQVLLRRSIASVSAPSSSGSIDNGSNDNGSNGSSRDGGSAGDYSDAAAAGGFEIEHVAGSLVECETPRYCNDADKRNISKAAAAAARADVVLLFLGMNPNGGNGP